MKIQSPDQLVGQRLRGDDGCRLGRVIAVSCPAADPYTAEWLVVGLLTWPPRMRAVPGGQVRWGWESGLTASLRRAQVLASPALCQHSLDAKAVARLSQFYAAAG